MLRLRERLAMNESTPGDAPAARQTLAWGVHLLTASGAVLAAVALIAITEGRLARAALLMLAALAIDSVDGTLARAVGVAEVLPRVDGRRLDDMVDFLNYVIVPALFLVAAGSLLAWPWAIVPILASAYGFSQAEAKTADQFFLGWPSYWNVVAIYLWLLGISPAAGTAWVVGFAAAVFVPVKYLYPSKMPVLRRTTTVAGIVWGLMLTAAILNPDAARRFRLVEISLVFPAYYMVLSFWLGGLRRSRL
jgi:phosphatidylcholine synthase